MRSRAAITRRAVVVGSIWAMTVGGAMLLTALGWTTPIASAVGPWLAVFTGLGIDVVVFASVGAILAMRRPRNVVGVVLLLSGPLIVTTFCGFIVGARLADTRGAGDPLAELASLIASVTVFPTLVVVGPVLALVFPDGRLPSRSWRRPVAGIGGVLVVGTAMSLVKPGPLNVGLGDNPLGIRGTTWVEPVSTVGATLAALTIPAALCLAVAAVIVRYRRASPIEREQLKWFLAANAATLILIMAATADAGADTTWIDVAGVASLSLPPIAVGIAIMRYRLYEIDRLISRTVSWAVVTGVLATVFVSGVIALQAALARFTEGQTVAVAASTLVALALFQPLRRRVQSAVDRRFDRTRYDAQHTVDAFAERLRSEIDLARLRTALLATAGDAVRPASAAVWLRAGSDGRR